MNLVKDLTDIHNTTAFQKDVIDKVLSYKRLTIHEGIELFHLELPILGILSSYKRAKLNENNVYFNKNIHLEPTNICTYNCKFCSYHRKFGEEGAWEYSIEDMLGFLRNSPDEITEAHIVGGVHPKRDIYFYKELLESIHSEFPQIHIKAFTAVEIDYMTKKANINLEDGFKILKNAGLGSIPGGGAEIFNDEIRKEICHEKSSSAKWIDIHTKAHKLGIPSNATMLYGHIESNEDRIEHLDRLRKLQDETRGFNAFIPLKYKSMNNRLSYIKEVNLLEDMKVYAVSRLFLDNIKHLKAYWPMMGIEAAQLSLSFGVDDMDGTINDSTKIYTMAGANNKKSSLSGNELISIIKESGYKPVERDSVYNTIKKY